jgi:hypothetical protein
VGKDDGRAPSLEPIAECALADSPHSRGGPLVPVVRNQTRVPRRRETDAEAEDDQAGPRTTLSAGQEAERRAGQVQMTTATAPLRKRESHLWARDPHDFYVEPGWVSQCLFEVIPFVGEVIDPACGSGRIVEAARRAHHASAGWDIIDRGFPGTKVRDFLSTREPVCNIICNPPFGIAEKFVAHALELARHQVCMLLPTIWLQGDKRSRWLETTPLARVLFITPRPSMPPRAAIEAGQKPGNGTRDYAWFCWFSGHRGPPTIGWLRKS